MLNLEEIQATNGLGCELCSLCASTETGDVGPRILAFADLERRASTGGVWQLCRCCQIALALWDSGGVDDLPIA